MGSPRTQKAVRSRALLAPSLTLDAAQSDAAHEVFLYSEERNGDGTDRQDRDCHLCGERRYLDAECLAARLQDRDVGRDLIQQVLKRYERGIVDEEQSQVPVVPIGERAKQPNSRKRRS